MFSNSDVLERAFPDHGLMDHADGEQMVTYANELYRQRQRDEARNQEIERIQWERKCSRSEAVRILNGTMRQEAA